jgi:hypothetical protein
MNGKMKLYISLLVLGVVVIAGGIWALVSVSSSPAPASTSFEIPSGNPVVYEKQEYLMRGQVFSLYLYDDGGVLYIEEKGYRPPGSQATRTWKTGAITPQEMSQLLDYLENSGFGDLEEDYQFPGEPIDGGGFRMGDMGFTVIVNSDNLSRSVTAFGYLTPDQGETYPDMPVPLGEIYVKLRAIAAGTQEVAVENIS